MAWSGSKVRWAVVVGLLVPACGSSVTPGDGGGATAGSDTTTASSTSGAGPTNTSTDGGTPATNDGVDGDTEPFSDTECLPEGAECDLHVQDCPRGEKCAPTPSDACSYWNTAQCMPVPDEPVAEGEPCVGIGGAFSSEDDCDAGLVCWQFSDRWEGTCIPLCEGSAEDPTCPPWFQCATVINSVVDVCFPMCDPLADDCADGYTCQLWGLGSKCTVNDDPQPLGEPCGFQIDCESGATCINEVFVPGCAGDSCCVPFCDLTTPDPSAVCPRGTTCEAYGDLLPELAHLGRCVG